MATGETAFGIATQRAGLRVLPEVGMVGSWPLRSSLELAAAAGEVSGARRHARHILRVWGLPAHSDDTELVVSELVSNAVAISAATNQQDIRLWLISDGWKVLVLTWDASLDPPEIAGPAADAENGRGLLLVEALSTRWGWYFAAGLSGKVVWALIDPDSALRKGIHRPAHPNQIDNTCQPGSTPRGEQMTITAVKVDNPRELIAPSLFDKLTLRVMADDGLDRDTAERIVEQALAFLVACAHYPDGHLSPSQTVDAGWHAFILHTRDYAEFCQRIAGRFIHHRPNGPGEAVGEQQAIGVTIAAMRDLGVPVDADLWVPRAECSQCYQGCADDPKGA
jgi:anti-sigma regulatory factor (Ser/Thr protein kinase)